MFEEQHILENLSGSIYFKTVVESYTAYKNFCTEAGFRFSLGRNGFSKRMEALGFEKSKTTEGWKLEKNFTKKKV